MIPLDLGVREVSMLFMLNKFEISNEIGLGLVTNQRIMSTGLGNILGSIAMSVLGIRNIKIHDSWAYIWRTICND